VAREGLEAALFLIAAATTEEGWAVLVGGLVGLAAASVLGAMFGWDPRPSIEQVAAYLLFLVTVAWLFLRPPRSARSKAQQPAHRAP
jgi:high-affinity Fe2+/Pb2+ permease